MADIEQLKKNYKSLWGKKSRNAGSKHLYQWITDQRQRYLEAAEKTVEKGGEGTVALAKSSAYKEVLQHIDNLSR